MLKENDAYRKLLNVDIWHKAGYTGKNVHIVIIDENNGKPRKGTENYLTDVLGTAKESGHAANVAQVIHEYAPDAKISFLANTTKAFEWVKANKDTIDLINISLGSIGGVPTPEFLPYESLRIPIHCAAGNDYYTNHLTYPAEYPFTIAIGASVDDRVTLYSNRGKMLIAVCPSGTAILNDKGEVWEPTGTSFSSPLSVTLSALYVDFRKVNGLPKLTEDDDLDFIMHNCIDIEDVGRDDKSGYGLFCLPAEIPKIIKKEINAMPKVYISPSSQETNKGLTPFTTEEIQMNGIADILIPLLVKDGRFTVKRNSPAMDPYQMAADSNAFGADIHVAIHSNAGGGVGTEVETYGPGTNSEKLGKCLYNQIAPLSPGADRGVKYNPGLIEVGNSVNATSALIELAFHDNQTDATWLAYNHEMIAQALYKGICDYFNYAYKALVVTPVVTPPVTSADDKTAKAIDLLNQAIAILKEK